MANPSSLKPFKKGDIRASEAGKKSKRPPSIITQLKKHLQDRPQDILEIVEGMIQDAKTGTHADRKLLIEYLDGKVTDKIEHTGADGEPIKTLQKIEVEFVKPKSKATRKA